MVLSALLLSIWIPVNPSLSNFGFQNSNDLDDSKQIQEQISISDVTRVKKNKKEISPIRPRTVNCVQNDNVDFSDEEFDWETKVQGTCVIKIIDSLDADPISNVKSILPSIVRPWETSLKNQLGLCSSKTNELCTGTKMEDISSKRSGMSNVMNVLGENLEQERLCKISHLEYSGTDPAEKEEKIIIASTPCDIPQFSSTVGVESNSCLEDLHLRNDRQDDAVCVDRHELTMNCPKVGKLEIFSPIETSPYDDLVQTNPMSLQNSPR